jgi:hypothetical protein
VLRANVLGGHVRRAACDGAVLIDPTTGTRLAGADPRRDCYAFAY